MLIAALLGTVPLPPGTQVSSAAQASARVLHAARASESQWRASDARHVREILVKEADGRMSRLRLIEYE